MAARLRRANERSTARTADAGANAAVPDAANSSADGGDGPNPWHSAGVVVVKPALQPPLVPGVEGTAGSAPTPRFLPPLPAAGPPKLSYCLSRDQFVASKYYTPATLIAKLEGVQYGV